eukprot:9481614-Ditylum_brightwellii.AAC.1
MLSTAALIPNVAAPSPPSDGPPSNVVSDPLIPPCHDAKEISLLWMMVQQLQQPVLVGVGKPKTHIFLEGLHIVLTKNQRQDYDRHKVLCMASNMSNVYKYLATHSSDSIQSIPLCKSMVHMEAIRQQKY